MDETATTARLQAKVSRAEAKLRSAQNQRIAVARSIKTSQSNAAMAQSRALFANHQVLTASELTQELQDHAIAAAKEMTAANVELSSLRERFQSLGLEAGAAEAQVRNADAELDAWLAGANRRIRERRRAEQLAREHAERERERQEAEAEAEAARRKFEQAQAHRSMAPKSAIASWLERTRNLNAATLLSFPTPPAWPCACPECQVTAADRALQACRCNTRAIFQSFGQPELKAERTRWHPDKFAASSAEVREVFQKMAGEIFVIVDEMYRDLR